MKVWLRHCLYNVGNGLYRVFTTAKKAFSFQKKRAFIQEILFRSLNGAFKPRKKGTFFTLKKSGAAHAPIALRPAPLPGSAAPGKI
jgi:hypothetical protein